MCEVQNFLVRIYGTVGELPLGCGFLIDKDKRHVLTCSHVVNVALNRRAAIQPSEPLYLDFPFLAPNRLLKAVVERWHYATDDPLHDICVLKLLDDVPSSAQPAPMIRATDYSGDAFRAFGFPKDFESNGREVKGILGAKQVNGRVLAEGISQFGYFIESGFSGTPIWNSTRDGVCGMAFQVDTPAMLKVASIIPTEQLMQVADDLIELSGTIPSYLRRLIADLESRRGVLQYVDLSGQTEVSSEKGTSEFEIDDEFGFSELVQRAQSPEKETVKLGKIRDVLEKHQRFVLIGEAGSSKTTTLRRLALEAARKRVRDDSAPLPLLLYLPRWEGGLSPEEFVRDQWIAARLPVEDDPIELLKSGIVLLYLDGLNEMGGRGAENAKQLKTWLASAESPRFVIVSCRKDDYVGDFDLGLPIVQLESMSEELIRTFVHNYLSTKADALLQRIFSQSSQTDNERTSLAHLARNPYLLSALIVLVDHAPNSELPRNNGKLLQMLVRALVKREEQRGTLTWITLKDKFHIIEQRLTSLAYAMIKDGTSTEVGLDYAYHFINNEQLLAAHSANFVDLTQNSVRFYHQMMQEYFAAIRLRDTFSPEFLKDGPKLYGAFPESRWENVVINLLGLYPQQADVLEAILEVNPLLASRAFDSGIEISDEYVEAICLRLIQIAATQWNYALNDFNHYDEAYAPYELYALDNFDWIAGTIEDAIAKFAQKSTKVLIQHLEHPDPEVCQVVLRALKRTKDVDAVAPLRKCLDDKRRTTWNETISEEALAVLLAIDDPRAQSAIQDWKLHFSKGDIS